MPARGEGGTAPDQNLLLSRRRVPVDGRDESAVEVDPVETGVGSGPADPLDAAALEGELSRSGSVGRGGDRSAAGEWVAGGGPRAGVRDRAIRLLVSTCPRQRQERRGDVTSRGHADDAGGPT